MSQVPSESYAAPEVTESAGAVGAYPKQSRVAGTDAHAAQPLLGVKSRNNDVPASKTKDTSSIEQLEAKRRPTRMFDKAKGDASGGRRLRELRPLSRETSQAIQGRPAVTFDHSGIYPPERLAMNDNGSKTKRSTRLSLGSKGSEGSQGDLGYKVLSQPKTSAGFSAGSLAGHDLDIRERQLTRDHQQAKPSLHEELLNLQRLVQIKSKHEAVLEAELKNERQLVKDLENTIDEQEASLNQANSAAINLLIQDVSTTYPDDHIKRDFQRFFDGDLLGWCMDYAVGKIENPNAAMLLIDKQVLMKVPGATESTIPIQLLLRAALTQHLYQSFLHDPFKPWKTALRIKGHVFENAPRQDLMSWRVHTLNFLETAIARPHHHTYLEDLVHDFASCYACILQRLDKQALVELAEIHNDFYELSLKLWKRRSQIIVDYSDHPDFQTYKAGTPGLEVVSSVFSNAGKHNVNGRPIQALIRPRVVGVPVLNDGSLGEAVVWSSALVWVAVPGKA